MSDYLTKALPGLLLCAAITAGAYVLQAAEVALTGHAYIEALVLAILLGVVVRTAWIPGPRFAPGIAVSARFVLECAIVMLGATVSVTTILALGPVLIFGI